MINIKQYLIVAILMLLFLKPVNANDFMRGTISATASVMPVLGQMPNIVEKPGFISSKNELLIQIPKNSTFLLHMQIDSITQSVSSHNKVVQSSKAASDYVFITLPENSINASKCIITIISSEN